VRERVLGNCRADIIALVRDGVVQGTGMLWMVLYAYFLYLSVASASGGEQPGYYARQGLLTAALFGRFAAMVFGAALGGRDGDWGTRVLRFTESSRVAIVIGRFLLLAIMSMAITVVAWLPGTLLDWIAGLAAWPSVGGAVQFVVGMTAIFFWSCIAFAVASLTGGFAAGAILPICWVLAEMWLEGNVPAAVTFLPEWNSLIVLRHAFTVDEGVVSPWTGRPTSLWIGVGVSLGYLAASVGASSVAIARREI